MEGDVQMYVSQCLTRLNSRGSPQGTLADGEEVLATALKATKQEAKEDVSKTAYNTLKARLG